MTGVCCNLEGHYHLRPSADCTLMLAWLSPQHQRTDAVYAWPAQSSVNSHVALEVSGERTQTVKLVSVKKIIKYGASLEYKKENMQHNGLRQQGCGIRRGTGIPRAQCASQAEILEERSH